MTRLKPTHLRRSRLRKQKSPSRLTPIEESSNTYIGVTDLNSSAPWHLPRCLRKVLPFRLGVTEATTPLPAHVSRTGKLLPL